LAVLGAQAFVPLTFLFFKALGKFFGFPFLFFWLFTLTPIPLPSQNLKVRNAYYSAISSKRKRNYPGQEQIESFG
jgi:hypothetical protein